MASFSDKKSLPISPEKSWIRRKMGRVADWWVQKGANRATPRGSPRRSSWTRTSSGAGDADAALLCEVTSLDQVDLLSVVGQGGFGRVCLAELKREDPADPAGPRFAVKITDKGTTGKKAERRLRRYHAETALIEHMGQHPLLLACYSNFEDDASLYRVMEFLPGGTLRYVFSQRAGGASPAGIVRIWAAEIVSAVAYCHSNDVLYRDLKPQNLMLDAEGHLRLVDFDLAKMPVSHALQGAQTYCGTLEYMAPEVIARSRDYGFAVDWWGVGAVLHEALTGLPPFYMTDKEEMARRIVGENLRLTKATLDDDAARKLVLELLTREPSSRLGSSNRGAAAVFRHAFFRGVNWNHVRKKKLEPGYVPPAVEDAGLQVDRHVLRMSVPVADAKGQANAKGEAENKVAK
mmetsp:Transcript_26663/g.83421  ORF Transcript_26663/g.83421 Transcript_26663/m.83421 type:complete len:405 (-) Transcript_26663:426-1640(-)